MVRCRTAQRVTAAQRPQGGAVTQRRETDARCLCIGKQLADLPSGARLKSVGRRTALAMYCGVEHAHHLKRYQACEHR
jgi:hypothetical protein